jgi:hypothetical protein
MAANELTISRQRLDGTPIVGTAVGRLAQLSIEPLLGEHADQEKWLQLVDEKLIEWGRNGAELFGDDIDPPTKVAIVAAARLARDMRTERQLAPTRMVPDACGGIAFELERGPMSERFEIDAAGAIEYLRFVDCRLVSRYEVGCRG